MSDVYKVVLTIFEIAPYEIYILQDVNGELITIKTYEEGKRR
jgi:hypothetical protein